MSERSSRPRPRDRQIGSVAHRIGRAEPWIGGSVVVDRINIGAACDDQRIDHLEHRSGILGVDNRKNTGIAPALRTAFTYGALTT